VIYNMWKIKEVGIKRFVFSVISGSNPVVANMIAARDLHGR